MNSTLGSVVPLAMFQSSALKQVFGTKPNHSVANFEVQSKTEKPAVGRQVQPFAGKVKTVLAPVICSRANDVNPAHCWGVT